MTSAEIKDHNGTCISVTWSNSQTWSWRRKTASSERCGAFSVFGRGRSMRVSNLFTSSPSLSTLSNLCYLFFRDDAETVLPARVERENMKGVEGGKRSLFSSSIQ